MPQATDEDQSATGDDKIVADAKAYLEECIKADGLNRSNALDDLRFLSGDQWPVKAKRQRDLDGRPCLTINKLPTFLHQVTNSQRMNAPSIKVSPVGDGADVDSAKIRQGMIRHIEYASNADVAYDTAVNSAAAIGFGYFRLITDYCRPDSFDQDIRFRRIRNPFTVYFDPLSEEPDGSDARRCMISTKMSRDVFRDMYPNADLSQSNNMAAGLGDATNKDWVGDNFIRIAEYYRIEETAAKVVQLSNGESGWKDDLLQLPPGVKITKERESSRPKVMLYKLTALQVLEKTEVLCRWIPVFPVYGDEIDLDGEVMRSGLVRNAKDPGQMYNFWMTAATEEVALRTKTPFIGAAGQFEGYEDDWESANVQSLPYLEYKPVSLDGSLAPPPARQPMTDIPAGVLAMAMHANDNIKATTGLFDSSLGARGNATSGIQERSQQQQGDIANFHYADNLNRTVRHVGRCILDMLPKYYDATRIVRIMGEDDKIEGVPINQPSVQQTQDPETGEQTAVQSVINDMNGGEYDCTVKAGPSYSTLRQEAVQSMLDLGAKWPKLMDIAGDKMIRSMDWPGAEEIADRVAKTIPPELRDQEDQDGEQRPMVQGPQGPIPLEQAGEIMSQMQQALQQMQGELGDAKAGITKAQIDADAKVEVARMNAEGRLDVEELKGWIAMMLEKMQPPPALTAEVAKDVSPAPLPSPSQPDPAAMLMQVLQSMNRPRRKTVAITAPSGAVYNGQIVEDNGDTPADPTLQ